jgi:hypothetical protein
MSISQKNNNNENPWLEHINLVDSEKSFHEKKVLSPSPESLSSLDDVCELDKIYCPWYPIKQLSEHYFDYGLSTMTEVLTSMLDFALEVEVPQDLVHDYTKIMKAFSEGALSELDRPNRDAYCQVIE